MSSTKEKPAKIMAPALSRGLKILELLATNHEPQNLTTISQHLSIAMSSAHSLCTTLINEGYLIKQSDGSFQLALKILDLASSKISQYDIVEHFYAACDEIQIIRDNGATISVLDGADVYYIAARNSPKPLGVTFKVGMRLSAYSTASGRAILASLTDDEICEIYPDEDLPFVTSRHIRERSKLLEILKTAHAQGYSVENGGTRPHMYSYGALVASPMGRAVAGVAITMYEENVTDVVEKESIEAIQLLAKKLSQFTQLT